jgi:hypothetical protein
MKQPVGLEQMKQGYLGDIALRSNCNEQIDIDQQCINGKEIKDSKLNMTKNIRSLLLIFDGVAEPLFRSNIVFYSTISFFIFIIVTFIYDRIFVS